MASLLIEYLATRSVSVGQYTEYLKLFLIIPIDEFSCVEGRGVNGILSTRSEGDWEESGTAMGIRKLAD